MPTPAQATYRALVLAQRATTAFALTFLLTALALALIALSDDGLTEVPMMSAGCAGQLLAGLGFLVVRWLLGRVLRWHTVERASARR